MEPKAQICIHAPYWLTVLQKPVKRKQKGTARMAVQLRAVRVSVLHPWPLGPCRVSHEDAQAHAHWSCHQGRKPGTRDGARPAAELEGGCGPPSVRPQHEGAARQFLHSCPVPPSTVPTQEVRVKPWPFWREMFLLLLMSYLRSVSQGTYNNIFRRFTYRKMHLELCLFS